jgi:hypothetical protein
VGQFNLIGFVDDLSLSAQSLGGAQALFNAIQEIELWCGSEVNRKKHVPWSSRGWEQASYIRAKLSVHGTNSNFLSTLNVMQIPGSLAHAHSKYVRHERKNFPKT